MIRGTSLLVLGLFVLFGLGCGSTKPDLDMVYRHSADVFPQDAEVVFSWIKHRGPVESFSASTDPTGYAGVIDKNATSLAKAMAAAQTGPINLVVAGSDPAKTAATVVVASNMQPEPLPRLHLLFIGIPEHEAFVREAVTNTDARFTFRTDPGPNDRSSDDEE
ncbi:MAG: hypothetical protein AAGH92_12275 [Planctomycetota bacterium]